MKIAIFGDSFADDTMPRFLYPGWPSILKETYRLEVDNFALCGSSLYYAYREFLKIHEQYDKVIVVATTPNRIMIPDHVEFKNGTKYFRHVNGLEMIRHTRSCQSMLEPKDIQALDAASMYYLYLYDDEKEEIISDLIKTDIKNRRSDAILLDVSDKKNKRSGLFDLSRQELKLQGLSEETMHRFDNRTCHFSKENNKILADKIYGFLTGSPISLTLEDLVVPAEDMRQYFT